MKNFLVLALIIFAAAFNSPAQSGNKQKDAEGKKNRRQQQTNSSEKPASTDDSKSIEPDAKTETSDVSTDDEIVRVDTNLVTIPVTVSDRDGRFVSDLKKEDFQIFEDGKLQNIEYFAATETPFTVALVLDTSLSASLKIDEIQTAAYQFVMGLRPADRVLIVSFDEEVRVLSEPTSDRETLRQAIKKTRFGGGTSLYEAVYAAFKRMEKINGRKAIVLFTDGVDTTSRKTNDADNLYQAQEFEGLIYPIHYDTYEDVQAQLRNPPILNPNPVPGLPVPLPSRTPTIPGTNIPLPIPQQRNRRLPNPNDPRYPQDPNDPRYPPSSRRPDDPT
ncbi:MAG: VWA domain-containing protein, partial [Pyrinomonadaceae bacterium]